MDEDGGVTLTLKSSPGRASNQGRTVSSRTQRGAVSPYGRKGQGRSPTLWASGIGSMRPMKKILPTLIALAALAGPAPPPPPTARSSTSTFTSAGLRR